MSKNYLRPYDIGHCYIRRWHWTEDVASPVCLRTSRIPHVPRGCPVGNVLYGRSAHISPLERILKTSQRGEKFNGA